MEVFSKDTYVQGILKGDKVILSRAITLLESTRSEHNALAREVLESLLPNIGKSKRLGITGIPGVGKSTFIEALGEKLLAQGGKLAVLAIDPSSQLTKGSILGDKTRMEKLSARSDVYIRPSAAGEALGGVGRKTRESMMLCEAAGFDYVVVETVGVGQSEIAVHAMVDVLLLLLLPGAGDELQGIKRGIMEMADIICINKAYNEQKQLSSAAKTAKQEIGNALHYFPKKDLSWLTKVLCVDALSGINLEELVGSLKDYFSYQDLHGNFDERRKGQQLYWFHETIKQRVLNDFFDNKELQSRLTLLEKELELGSISSFKAADELLGIKG